MKEEKVYNVRYSESKGKIKLYLEPKKLVFKKTKGLFNFTCSLAYGSVCRFERLRRLLLFWL